MDKVVIVTGASGGIGSAIAERFGAKGARVLVLYASSPDRADEVVRTINKGPGQAFSYKADVSVYEEVRAMIDECIRKWQRIDILVNSAGGPLTRLAGKGDALLVDTAEEDWDLVLNVNLKGTFHMLKAVLPYMKKQREGNIVLIGSGSGLKPGKRQSAYAASKAGVLGLMKAAVQEVGEDNIKINAVCPGYTPHRYLPEIEAVMEFTRKSNALGRTLPLEDFADFVVYVAQMDNTSGQTFNIDSRAIF
jgi:3-oxoacyl-[acyl-carrier protein] reductase